MPFIDLVFAGSVFLCILTALVIWFRIQGQPHFPARILAAYLFLNALCFGFYLVISYGLITYVPVLYKMPAPISYLIPPLAYIHVRAVLFREKTFKKTDALHLLPFLFFMGNYLPFYLMDIDGKREIVAIVADHLEAVYVIQNGLLPEWVNILARTLMSFLYLGLQWSLLLRFFGKEDKAMVKGQDRLKKWLYDFTGIITFYNVALVAIYVVMGLMTASVLQEGNLVVALSRIFIAIGFFVMAGYLLWHPNILIGLPSLVMGASTQKESPNEQLSFFKTVASAVEEDQLFLNPKLTVHQLAQQIEVPARKITESIGASPHQNFNHYINTLRVHYAKNRIYEGYLRKHSIEALGKISGFHSKNAFYRAFKKEFGATPKDFEAKLNAPSMDMA